MEEFHCKTAVCDDFKLLSEYPNLRVAGFLVWGDFNLLHADAYNISEVRLAGIATEKGLEHLLRFNNLKVVRNLPSSFSGPMRKMFPSGHLYNALKSLPIKEISFKGGPSVVFPPSCVISRVVFGVCSLKDVLECGLPWIRLERFRALCRFEENDIMQFVEMCPNLTHFSFRLVMSVFVSFLSCCAFYALKGQIAQNQELSLHDRMWHFVRKSC